MHRGKYSNDIFQSTDFNREWLYFDDELNLPPNFLCSLSVRNPNAEDSVCRP